MKKLLIILLSVSVFASAKQSSFSQVSKNSGTIRTYNTGKVIIKNTVLESDGQIINEGKIEVDDSQLRLKQNSIDGTVDFKSDVTSQELPQVSYEKLNLLGKSRKEVKYDNQNIEVRSKLYTEDSTRIIWDPAIQNFAFDIRNEIEHFGRINPAYTHGKVNLNGTVLQDIHGTGRYTSLELDNSAGANVINGGGFSITGSLILNRGVFNNSISNNFKMEDTSKIVRRIGSSLAEAPQFQGSIDVRYEGTGKMVNGKEIPVNSTLLRDLEVATSEGLQLSSDIVANRNIKTSADIQTYTVDANDDVVSNYELRLKGANNPVFLADDIEIKGKFTRSDINWNNQQIVFNNPYTYAIVNAADVNTMNAITMDIKPKRIYKEIEKDGNEKIQRTVEISAKDINGTAIENQKAKVALAWKHNANNQNSNSNETSVNLIGYEQDLKIQRWDPSSFTWETIEETLAPTLVSSSTGQNWYVSIGDILKTGEYTVGLPDLNKLYFTARVIMEGAWRQEKESMDYELRQQNLIPTTPPDIYPYNLDPNRTTLYANTVIPDSVVDWVVIEFRDAQLSPNKRYYRTCFLKYNGDLVDHQNGNRRIDITAEYAQNLSDDDLKSFYVAVHHRNHFAVMTDDAILITRKNNTLTDFTDQSKIFSKLKPVGFKNGSVVFGMFGGNNPMKSNLQLIDEDDYSSAWDMISKLGYLNEDYYLNGIVTTNDYNVSWNNRGEETLVK